MGRIGPALGLLALPVLVALSPLLATLPAAWTLSGGSFQWAWWEVPLKVFWLGLLGCLAWRIGQVDRWLGALLGWIVLSAGLLPLPRALEVPTLALGGALLLLVARTAPPAVRLAVRRLFVGLGLLEVGLLGIERLGGWAPLPVVGMHWGSFLQPSLVGLLLAFVLPLAAGWALVPLGLGLGLLTAGGHAALVAASLGLAARFRGWARWTTLSTAGVGLVAWLGWAAWISHDWPQTLRHRVEMWGLVLRSLRDLEDPLLVLIGLGPGSWDAAFGAATFARFGERFADAHSEPVQTVAELGVMGLVLAAGWLAAHARRLGRDGAAVAVLVACLAWSVFHLPSLAPMAAVLLGLATAPEPA